jgi:hypothetical protein
VPEQAAIMTALILERPMCVECIATKANMSMSEAQRYLQIITRAVPVVMDKGRCRTCGESRATFSVRRP